MGGRKDVFGVGGGFFHSRVVAKHGLIGVQREQEVFLASNKEFVSKHKLGILGAR